MKTALLLLALFASLPAHANRDRTEICPVAIGAIMGRDPTTMVVRDATSFASITYKRDDGQFFSYHCYLENNRVIWRTRGGRWRVDSRDSTITWSAHGDGIRIRERFSDGSDLSKVWTGRAWQ